jgi:PEP-CTERM motif
MSRAGGLSLAAVRDDASNLGWDPFIVLEYDFETTALSSAVPEPSTWAMVFLGVAGVGFIALSPQLQPRLNEV